MNYLELCRRARLECGIARSTVALPTTVTGQVGQLASVVNWVNDVWLEIQREHNWSFMWEEVSVTIVAGTNSTATSLSENRWEKESARIGDGFLQYLPWADFRLMYPTVSTGAAGQAPSVWSIRPDGAFVVNIRPTADVTITAERYKAPVSMVADSDEPTMPSDLHMLVVWGAVIKYANDAEAGVKIATAHEEYGRLHQQLLATCLPTVGFAAPLA